MSWSTLGSFLAGVVTGQLALVLALWLVRGPERREADEHEGGAP